MPAKLEEEKPCEQLSQHSDRLYNLENEIRAVSGAPRAFWFGGNILGGRPRRGSGWRSPPLPENFENFQKILKKNSKNGLF